MKGSTNPSLKGKPSDKADRPPNKPKVVMGSIVGEIPDASKFPLSLVLGREKA